MTPRSRRLWLRLGLSVLVVGVILAVVVGGAKVKPDEVLHTLGRIGPGAAVLALLAILAQMTCIMTRLWLLFPAPRPRYPRLAYAFFVGEIINNFLPARSGDVLKVVVLSGEGTPRTASETVGVMLSDQVINLTTLAILLTIVGPGKLLGGSAWSRLAVFGLVLVAGAVVMWLVRRNHRVRKVLAGMQALRSWQKLAGGTLLSCANWSCEYLALRFLAAELGGHLGFADAIRLLFLFNLGIAFNLSVANVGTFEVPIALGLAATGLAFSEGLAIGAAYHVLQIVGIALMALVMVAAKRLRPAPFVPS